MARSEPPKKTVYVLGAGFSAPAGGPNQATLLRQIFDLPEHTTRVAKLKETLEEFLTDVLSVDPGSIGDIALEDIYTPIDRCLADGVSLRNKPPAELRLLRSQIEFLISMAIQESFASKPSSAMQYVRDFAAHLVELASDRAKKAKGVNDADEAKAHDPFSIISLNWDILLDSSLYQALGDRDHWTTDDYAPIGVVDYCCYISSVDPGEKRIRSGLWALGSKGYNVKLLKIHGSMNWLQCSNCQRLFVAFNEKINIPNYINAESCRHCSRYGVDAKLQGSLVMPTFLKDLSNFQIKLVWQNAAVELMEANQLVFIGYSLPNADFEFRQLLSRMVHKEASIHAVLFNSGTPESQRQYDEECNRYRQFFGARKLSFEQAGVLKYVNDLCSRT